MFPPVVFIAVLSNNYANLSQQLFLASAIGGTDFFGEQVTALMVGRCEDIVQSWQQSTLCYDCPSVWLLGQVYQQHQTVSQEIIVFGVQPYHQFFMCGIGHQMVLYDLVIVTEVDKSCTRICGEKSAPFLDEVHQWLNDLQGHHLGFILRLTQSPADEGLQLCADILAEKVPQGDVRFILHSPDVVHSEQSLHHIFIEGVQPQEVWTVIRKSVAEGFGAFLRPS
mmetsp:Transcript_61152/g.115327  ORF Transcript_61152/g.115327 Transcript_61152/m.115327 type:complete len:224 (-) Transcript_61152:103-774(-)